MLIVEKIFDRLCFYLYFRNQYKKKFLKYGDNIRWGRDGRFLTIPRSIRISCPEKISLGNNVRIDEGVYLQCHPKGGGIEIKDDCRINSHTHIQAFSKISLGEKVLVAPFCLMNNGKHGIGDNSAIMDQDYVDCGEISIAAGAWLGHGSKVLGGVSISSNSTIACSAVVTKSFYSSGAVIVGIPAREVREK
ncbi:acyltransferase [Halobacteriovorax sp. HLS]|uniref:acyltransferase n=1 Tax=Halobacteriovorax sp. HLS TaxID=2234000 RepID=UPI000FD6BFAF|nr:acyltransferase [Halobacteriovorax sp. HLS]